jgi:RNA polymerase sigma-70 factor (ECF subfamily)
MPLQPAIADQQIIPLTIACQRGEASAAEAIYDLYVDRIYRYLLARTGDPHAAEDLTSEVFVRMIEHIGRFQLNHDRAAASFSAWMYRIAANLTADYHRSGSRQNEELSELLPSDEPGPQSVTERREIVAELSLALQDLTEEQRLVVIGRFAEGMSNREIAGMLGKSEGAVESMQHRALRRLGGLLRREKV